MPGYAETVKITKDLLFRLATIVRNGDRNPLTYASKCMDMLGEIRAAFPEEYDERVKRKKITVYAKQRDRQAKEYTREGEYINNGKPWTKQQLDELLERFLSYEYPMLAGSGRLSLVQFCGRPVKAIQVALWRLAVKDPERSAFRDYKPLKSRPGRTGQPFKKRDWFIMFWALSDKSVEYNGHILTHIAWVLNRDRDEVYSAMEALYNDAYLRVPSLKRPGVFDYEDYRHRDVIRNRLKKLIRSIAKEFSRDNLN